MGLLSKIATMIHDHVELIHRSSCSPKAVWKRPGSPLPWPLVSWYRSTDWTDLPEEEVVSPARKVATSLCALSKIALSKELL